MLLVLMVGPDLISQDLRFNAIPLYFARPLRSAGTTSSASSG